jgi:hypothetical protein
MLPTEGSPVVTEEHQDGGPVAPARRQRHLTAVGIEHDRVRGAVAHLHGSHAGRLRVGRLPRQVEVEPVARPMHVPDLPGPPNADRDHHIDRTRRDGPDHRFTVEESNHDVEVHVARQRDYGFDLEHVEEHLARRLPVRVTLEERFGALYAVEILDV